VRVTIFDYGAGNLHSLAKAIDQPETEVRLAVDPAAAVDTDVLILPGVGAFGPAAARLGAGRHVMRSALEGGLPCLGICLGMQLLFERSDEGPGLGLGLIPGRVQRIEARRAPHIGWNTIEFSADPLFEAARLEIAYFANGYVCRPESDACVVAWTTHEQTRFPAAIRCGNTLGVQFHPEKSSATGIRFVHAFLNGARA